MRSLLITVLHFLTRRVLRRYQPLVIGITGSVGKTSTKEALWQILQGSGKHVGKSSASFNTEIGVPLAVLGVARSPRTSLLGWFRVFLKAGRMLLGKPQEYPPLLILELGADRPGDIETLVAVTRPKIGVLTSVGPAHLEGFGTVDAVRAEKKKILTMLPDQGIAILPGDEAGLGKIRKEVRARIITVGASEDCDLRIFDIHASLDPINGSSLGTYFKFGWKGSIVPCFLPHVLGGPAVRSAGFAAAVALALELHPLMVSEALRNWIPPSGRMRMIPGMKQTLLIDDSYNSSPNAVVAACEAVHALEWKGRRLFVLGDMAELGAASRKEHGAIGTFVASQKPDYFVAVGPMMVAAVRAAEAAGFPEENTFHWPDAAAAGRFLQARIHAGDLLLIKGSQIMRMERIVKELMAEPLRAEELLVRQGPEWSQEEGRMKVGG